MFTEPDAVIVFYFKFSSLVCFGRESQKFFAAPLASPPGLVWYKAGQVQPLQRAYVGIRQKHVTWFTGKMRTQAAWGEPAG
jgi:hypothetical protein